GVLITGGEQTPFHQTPFLYEGNGECRIDIDHATGGYVAILSPRAAEPLTPSADREEGDPHQDTDLFKPAAFQPADEPESTPSSEEDNGELSGELPPEARDVQDNAVSDDGERNIGDQESGQDEGAPEESAGGDSQTPDTGDNGTSAEETPVDQSPGEESADEETLPGEAPVPDEPRQETVPAGGEDRSTLPLPLIESLRDQEKPSGQGLLFPGNKQYRHTLTLHLLFKASVVSGNEYQLKATFAPAVSSRLRLEVPLPDVQLSVSEGTLALPPVSLNETTSEIVLNGLNRVGKPTELFWWKREDRQSDTQKILQVEDALITATLGDQQVHYDVVYPVRLFGGGTDLLKINLPPFARILRDSVIVTTAGGASIPVRDVKETDPDLKSSSVDIRLAQDIQEGVTVQFRATISDPKPTEPSSSHADVWELGGFSVQGAQKQTGRMTVRLPKETGFLLLPQAGIRTENSESAGLGNDEENFAFFTQPFSLAAQKIERQARTSVAAELQLYVHQQYTQLFSQFRFTVHGGTVHEFRFQTADWFVNSVKPDNIVDVERIYTDPETKELVLPLLVPTEGDVTIQLGAVRQIDGDDLAVSLPTCRCDWSEPDTVVVIPDDDIELIPQEEKTRNLLPRGTRTLKLTMDVPGRQQIPLVYQTQHLGSDGEHPCPVFAATLCRHEQQIESTLQTEVLLTEDAKSNQIRQTWTCRVSYEALREITLQLPAQLRENSSFTLTVNGKPVTPQDIQSPDLPSESVDDQNSVSLSEEGSSSEIRKRVVFPDGEQIGICTITLQYPFRDAELREDLTNWIRLPLASCEEGTLLVHRLVIKTRPGIQIDLADDAADWVMEEHRTATVDNIQEYHLYTDKKPTVLPIRAVVSAREALGTTVVERVWIQTWLIGGNRFERVAARVTSDREQFLVKLPPAVRR
ncbi:MAG: hypothetical protein J6S75_05370, partial [Thermoguttaceae bacterium]|nr:hypothetical protein [Thermoguttaceae bacterium]